MHIIKFTAYSKACPALGKIAHRYGSTRAPVDLEKKWRGWQCQRWVAETESLRIIDRPRRLWGNCVAVQDLRQRPANGVRTADETEWHWDAGRIYSVEKRTRGRIVLLLFSKLWIEAMGLVAREDELDGDGGDKERKGRQPTGWN